jgi:hypothetical protein
MRQAGEPVLVEALVSEAAVERFDVGVLRRLAWLDQAQRDATVVRPVSMARPQNSKPLSVRSTRGRPRVAARSSRTRVTGRPPSARAGTTATASVVASSTMVKHFHASFRGAIEDEVRRPHLVRRLRASERLPIGQWHAAAGLVDGPPRRAGRPACD